MNTEGFTVFSLDEEMSKLVDRYWDLTRVRKNIKFRKKINNNKK